MTIEEQLQFVDEYYARVGPEALEPSVYQAAKILIKNGFAELSVNQKDRVQLVSTELGRAWAESCKQEVLQ